MGFNPNYALVFVLGITLFTGVSCDSCSISDSDKVDCGYYGIKEAECESSDCCWYAATTSGTPWCFFGQSNSTTTDDAPTVDDTAPTTDDGTCTVSDSRKVDCGYSGIDETKCESKGCCWYASSISGTPWCYYHGSNSTTTDDDVPTHDDDGHCLIDDSMKIDCGFSGIDESSCEDKGCCWFAASTSSIPWCFYDSSFVSKGYNLTNFEETDTGYEGILELIQGSTVYGDDLTTLKLEVMYETQTRFHLKINSIDGNRWEVPQSVVTRSTITEKASETDFSFSYTESPFTFSVTRNSDGRVLFDSSAATLTFKDQFIQLATSIDEDVAVFGIGESTRTSMKLVPGSVYTLWDRDMPAMVFNHNLYGSHPFFVGVVDGTSYGVLLLSSNGMDVYLQDSSLVYKVIGGIVDLYVFTGPTPADVAAQYTELIGRPALQPYWSLGFHNCRYGYSTIYEVEEVADSYFAANIPIDTFWTDIDYMDAWKDFTTDPVNFPTSEMKSFVDSLHETGHYFVPIIDPGIMVDDSYSAYTDGMDLGVFIKDISGGYYLGQVWPGPTYFPDFFHPDSTSYWEDQIEGFYELLPVDGLWIDMNEVANFCNTDGASQVCSNPGNCPSSSQTSCCLSCETVDTTNTYDFPPYNIHNDGGSTRLGYKAVAPSATHYNGTTEYDAHNLYGIMESIATHEALQNIRGKRPFVLSRSTFVGSGVWTAHWTGDNAATWDDLKASIIQIMNMGLFGVPMVGADICGFIGDTTEELCNRWIELGAFYPFSRDHNNKGQTSQELYRWESVTKSSQNALGMRYRLLPYLYTLFYQAHTEGALVARPLWLNFPSDASTIDVDKQFMLGDGLLISPVLDQGVTEVTAYFPSGIWYNLFDDSIISCASGCTETLESDLYTIQVHGRGGVILPMHASGAMTTQEARNSPFTLLVLLDSNNEAQGTLFLDDGEQISVDSADAVYSLINFSVSSSQLTSTVIADDYSVSSSAPLQTIVIKGITSSPSKVLVNGSSVSFTFTSSKSELSISSLSLSITSSLVVTWQ